MNTFARIVLLVSIACCQSLALAAAPGTLRTVAVAGQPAPGVPGMAAFSFFSETLALNAAGQTAFVANLLVGGGVNSDNDAGIWSEGSGALALVAREGSPAPGTPVGVSFSSSFFNAMLNSAGQTAFNGFLRGVDVTDNNATGIWTELSGSLQLLARRGNQAPGVQAGANFGGPSAVRLVDDHAAFSTLVLQNGGVTQFDDTGIWRGDGITLALVVREGSQAPGAPAGAVFGNLSQSTPALGGGGQIAFSAELRAGVSGVTASNNMGIWSETDGTLGLVAREGSQAPGVPIGVNFGNFSSIFQTINGTGQVAFITNLQLGGVVTGANDSGVWSQGSGVLALVAREGDPAPGAPVGSLFSQLGQLSQTPVLNSEGRTAFVGSLQIGLGGVTSSNDSGLWSDRSGALQLVAREGSQAPGTPSGANFDFMFARSTATIVLNSAGQMAFLTSLKSGSGGVTGLNDRGIWAEDLAGVLRLIVREGDSLEVTPGDFRTVSSLSFRGNSGNEDGRGSGFNDLGQVAFGATFTDGSSGVFVSNLATVPEPTSLALGVVVTLMAAAKRRGRFAMRNV